MVWFLGCELAHVLAWIDSILVFKLQKKKEKECVAFESLVKIERVQDDDNEVVGSSKKLKK